MNLKIKNKEQFNGVQFLSTPKATIGYFCHEFTQISQIIFLFSG